MDIRSLLESVYSAWLDARKTPLVPVAQTRITQTPTFIKQQRSPKVAGTYHYENPGAELNSYLKREPRLDEATRTGLGQLAGEWLQGEDGFIELAPAYAGRQDVVRHESVHDLWEKSGLAKHANALADHVSPAIKKHLALNSREYLLSQPEIIANEGLAYSATDPNLLDYGYVNRAKDLIEDPKLLTDLLRITLMGKVAPARARK